MVRQRFGTAVTAEVLEESVKGATQQVLSERGLRPAVQPKVDLISKDPGVGMTADLEFNIELELLPEIELPDFAAIALTRLKAEVSDDTVDKTLADIAGRNRGLEEIPPDELGDRGGARVRWRSSIISAEIDGVEFAGGTATIPSGDRWRGVHSRILGAWKA